jgi:glutamyl-tRNA reductase
MEIICLGLNHQTARVELREMFAVPDSDLAEVALAVSRRRGLVESVIVSTCNRVEFYAVADHAENGLAELSAMLRDRAGERHYDPALFYTHRSPASVRHLFRVVSGLDSMVLGESEIAGQVKKAYQTAVAGGSTGRHLNRMFQRAFRVAKEVRSNTAITRGPTSVAAAAVELAEKIFGALGRCGIMILGAGETGEQAARALLTRGAKKIAVANRSHERGVALAEAVGGRAVRFETWDEDFSEIDILIGSTSAPHFVLTREKLEAKMARRIDRPIFLIDLAVPRSIEPPVNDLDGVYLYDMDSLHAIVQQSIEGRRQELALCDNIIGRHVEEFVNWLEAEPGRAEMRALEATQNPAEAENP